MALIPPKTNSTSGAIESGLIIQKPRSYLGMSGIGHECMRAIWYGFRWATYKKITRRTQRIFDRGDLEEERIIKDLKRVGVECYRRGEDGEHIEIFGKIGEEQQEVNGFAGHAMGHTDGEGLGIIEAPKTPHLLEFKTSNAKNFKKFKDLGLERAHKVYFGQSQRYMKGMDLTRTLFIVTNKDNEERHYERVKFNKEHADGLVAKERNIILSEDPMPKAFAKTWFECKWCDHKDVCHNNGIPEVNCRTCSNFDIYKDGIFKCSLTDKEIDYDKQLEGCKSYNRGF